MVIEQGDVFWVSLPAPIGSGPGFRRPGLVIQSNRMNRSALRTVVICPITSSLVHAEAPGNVALAKGEANLPRRSVAVISGVLAVDRSLLDEKIGTVSRSRIRDVLAGLMVIVAPD
jgi:mRNA interferase MazF